MVLQGLPRRLVAQPFDEDAAEIVRIAARAAAARPTAVAPSTRRRRTGFAPIALAPAARRLTANHPDPIAIPQSDAHRLQIVAHRVGRLEVAIPAQARPRLDQLLHKLHIYGRAAVVASDVVARHAVYVAMPHGHTTCP
eukprot:1412572-Prymnesium_polylepis.1